MKKDFVIVGTVSTVMHFFPVKMITKPKTMYAQGVMAQDVLNVKNRRDYICIGKINQTNG